MFSKSCNGVDVDPVEATTYTEAFQKPDELFKVLVKKSSVGEPWVRGT